MTVPLLQKVWRAREPCLDPAACEQLLGVSSLTAHILAARSLPDLDAVNAYWSPRLEGLHEPELLPDMAKAAARLAQAVQRQEKIVIWGDYDVDGATSVSLLMRFFRLLGGRVDYYIPHRLTEGYGLNEEGLSQIQRQGACVVVTVDNGTAALQEAQKARQLGLDLIITDHHEPGFEIPEALAFVNPKRSGSLYPDTSLAGVGVAFKLACAVARHLAGGGTPPDNVRAWLLHSLALVAVGTVADLVPLTGENRILVGYGLHQLRISPWPGLKALLEVASCSRVITTSDIAFQLGPRINAAGRLDSAATGVEMMITDDPLRARRQAEVLDRANDERRRIEKEHTDLIVTGLSAAEIQGDRLVAVAGEGWHPGVIGIVASRLVERFHCPAVVCAFDEGVGKGSCRSVAGFHLHEALTRCQRHLQSFGGHAMAAGFTIRHEDWGPFVGDLRREAAAILTETPRPVLNIDAWIELGHLNDAVMNEIDHLAPFGMNNPRPVLAARGVSVTDVRRMGRDGDHLSFRCVTPGVAHRSVAYKAGPMASDMGTQTSWDLAFEPKWNSWNGRRNIELDIKGLRLTEDAI